MLVGRWQKVARLSGGEKGEALALKHLRVSAITLTCPASGRVHLEPLLLLAPYYLSLLPSHFVLCDHPPTDQKVTSWREVQLTGETKIR